MDAEQITALRGQLEDWAAALGFQALGVTDTELSSDEARLDEWLDQGYQGDMAWMSRHGRKRTRPEQLVPGTLRVISVRMDYWPGDSADAQQVLEQPEQAFVSRYALGRDYHKVLRQRLRRLAQRVEDQIGPFGYRVFCDSAPVMEKPLARKAGLGWMGKHTNLIDRRQGSWFFLGEIYTDLPLPIDPPESRDHCGDCTRCIDVCPTQAIVAPYQLDARRCISYLTIEHAGSIPETLRPALGNRIYGCDDCQLVCPWNRFAKPTVEPDFAVRHALDSPDLCSLFAWDEATFLAHTEGMAIRRIGHQRWLRNIAVALGNAPRSDAVISSLRARLKDPSELVREHVNWALRRHGVDLPQSGPPAESDSAP